MNLKNKIVYLPVVLILLLTACGERKENEKTLPDNFTLYGKINGAGKQSVYIEAISNEGTIDVAKGELEEDGSFELKGNIPGMGIYQMRLGDGEDKIIPLTMMPNDKVKITGDYNTFTTKPVFSGTEWAPALTQYMAMFSDFADKQRMLSDLKTKGATDQELMAEYNKMRKPLDEFAKKQMTKTPGNPVNIVLSSSLSPSTGWDEWDPTNLDVLKKVADAFQKRFAGSPISETMANQVFQIESGYAQHLNGGDVDNSPTSANSEMAPEIISKSPEGKTVRLSDLRGKFVLIDFWASWCGPCRKENPNVVRLYKQYKNKNFTVFSVSLDKDAQAWKQAILADGLIWPNHVSDLMQWDTPLLQTYNFNSIPHTVLVDKTGKVIARNLRGESLEQKLKEIL